MRAPMLPRLLGERRLPMFGETEPRPSVEGFNPLPPFGSAEHVHLLTESMRRAFMDRNKYLGDPAYVDLPLAWLLLKPHANLWGCISA